MKARPADRRTFYIERYGSKFVLMKTNEKGAAMDEDLQRYIMTRVMESNPDEHIIAVQVVSIRKGKRGLEMEADEQTQKEASRVVEYILQGGKVTPEGQPS